MAEADGDGGLVGGLAPLIVAHDVGVFHWVAEILRESIRNSFIILDLPSTTRAILILSHELSMDLLNLFYKSSLQIMIELRNHFLN